MGAQTVNIHSCSHTWNKMISFPWRKYLIKGQCPTKLLGGYGECRFIQAKNFSSAWMRVLVVLTYTSPGTLGQHRRHPWEACTPNVLPGLPPQQCPLPALPVLLAGLLQFRSSLDLPWITTKFANWCSVLLLTPPPLPHSASSGPLPVVSHIELGVLKCSRPVHAMAHLLMVVLPSSPLCLPRNARRVSSNYSMKLFF